MHCDFGRMLEQVPVLLPGQKVLILAGEKLRGKEQIRDLIEKLNAGGEWIRFECRDRWPNVPRMPDVRVAIYMVTIDHCLTDQVGKAVGDPCLTTPLLTTGQTKTFLAKLASLREAGENSRPSPASVLASPPKLTLPFSNGAEALAKLQEFAALVPVVDAIIGATQQEVVLLRELLEDSSEENERLQAALAEANNAIAECRTTIRKQSEVLAQSETLRVQLDEATEELESIRRKKAAALAALA